MAMNHLGQVVGPLEAVQGRGPFERCATSHSILSGRVALDRATAITDDPLLREPDNGRKLQNVLAEGKPEKLARNKPGARSRIRRVARPRQCGQHPARKPRRPEYIVAGPMDYSVLFRQLGAGPG